MSDELDDRPRRQIVNATDGMPVLAEYRDHRGVSRQRDINYATHIDYNPTPIMVAGAPIGSGPLAIQNPGNPALGALGNVGYTNPLGALQATFDGPTPVTIYGKGVKFNNGAPGGISARARPILIVTYGVGGQSITTTVDATSRGKFACVAEYVDVSVAFETSDNGSLIPSGTACHFDLEIVGGLDPDFFHPTRLLAPPNAGLGLLTNQFVIAGPVRLNTIYVFDSKNAAAGGGVDSLMIFDVAASPPANGAVPMIEVPIPAFPGDKTIVNSQETDLTFQQGFTWVASSTRQTLTIDAGAAFSVQPSVIRGNPL